MTLIKTSLFIVLIYEGTQGDLAFQLDTKTERGLIFGYDSCHR